MNIIIIIITITMTEFPFNSLMMTITLECGVINHRRMSTIRTWNINNEKQDGDFLAVDVRVCVYLTCMGMIKLEFR